MNARLNLPRVAAAAALTIAGFGATGCVVAPVGPPVAVGVYAHPYYGYYGRPAYYGPRGGGYYGRRW